MVISKGLDKEVKLNSPCSQSFSSKQKPSALSPKSPQLLFNSNKIQPKTAREERRYPIFVASEQGLDASALSEHLNRRD